ncbi:hypothetical protein Tco_1000412 [Tanacetum coccineum]
MKLKLKVVETILPDVQLVLDLNKGSKASKSDSSDSTSWTSDDKTDDDDFDDAGDDQTRTYETTFMEPMQEGNPEVHDDIHVDQVFSTWMAFGGNTLELGSLGEETDKITTLHQESLRIVHTERGDGLQVHIFYDRVDYTTQKAIDHTAGGRLRKLRPKVACETIKDLAQYEEEGWNDLVIPEEGSLDYKNPDLEQLLGVMECKVGTLIEKAVSLMGRNESIFGMSNNMMHQLPPDPSRQEAFEDLVMNFILDQEERVKQLEEYMCVIGSDFMQISLEVVGKLKEEIRMEENRTKKIKKITKYPDTEDLEPLNGHNFSEALIEKASFHTPKFVSPKSLDVKYVRTVFPIPPLIRESTFGFKSGTNNNQYVKSRYKVENSNPQSTPQVLPSFEEYTPPLTHPEEVEETIGILMEVIFDEKKLGSS